jgi:hypothetical protein
VIDLLARSGQLQKTCKFIDELPIKPTSILWRTLLSACGSHVAVDLAKRGFQRIFELDDSHYYAIFSKLLKRGGTTVQVQSCRSVEIDNRVHPFMTLLAR